MVVGLVGTAVTLTHRESDAAFAFRQEHPGRVFPAKVAEAVGKAREPVPPGTASTPSVNARCRALGPGQIGNPWACTVRYRSGDRIVYRLEIQGDGTFSGVNKAGDRRVTGRVGSAFGAG